MNHDLDIDLLRAFLAAVEGSSFTAAARSLNRTQSAVSMQIKRLEEIVGAALLERSSQRMALTRQGERLLNYAVRMVALNDEAISQLREEALAGVVRLGAMEDYAVHTLPAILSSFMALHPDVRIETETGYSPWLLQRLGDHYDLALAMSPDGSNKGEVVRRDRAVWVGSRQHKAHEQPIIPLALHSAGCQFRKVALDALDSINRPWRLVYTSQSLGAIEAATAAGFATTVGKAGSLPRGLVTLGSETGLPALPLFEISVHRAPGNHNLAAQALAEHMAMALRDGSA